MSDQIRIDIAGDRQSGLRFEEFPDHLRDALRDEISALTREAFGRYRAQVPVKTGKLQRQVREAVHNDPDKVKGVVYIDGKGSGSGSDFAKAGALEYGSTGKKFDVKAHRMNLSHVFERALAAPMNVLVKASKRHSTIREHRFARGTIESMSSDVLKRLNAVVERTIAQDND